MITLTIITSVLLMFAVFTTSGLIKLIIRNEEIDIFQASWPAIFWALVYFFHNINH